MQTGKKGGAILPTVIIVKENNAKLLVQTKFSKI